MKQQEIDKLLQKISNQRMFGETDKALANLHLLNNEFPEETKYLGLLASTYMEAGADDTAMEYCEKALVIDPDYAEAYEILGLLAEKKGEAEKAEEHYQQSLSKNNYFRNGHLRLMLLYYNQARYEEVITEAEFMLQNFDKERNNYTPDEKKKLHISWLGFAHFRLISSLIRLEEYEKAIKYINERVQFSQAYTKDPYQFHDEDGMLYKLYYLLDNQAKIAEYESRWLNHYKVPINQVIGMQKDAQQGYIESINPDNYPTDENGYII